MILFALLFIMLVTAVLGAVLLLGIGGGAFIVVFADVIVCAVIIGLLIKFLMNRRKK